MSNYGPIAEAKLDLRPLTVFIGPSNTGKSYLAILIYALHRFFSGASSLPENGFRESRRSLLGPFYFGETPSEGKDTVGEVRTLLDWAEQLEQGRELGKGIEELPHRIASMLRPQLQPNKYWNKVFRGELARCFGTPDTHSLIRHGHRSGAKFSLTHLKGEGKHSVRPLKFEYDLESNKFSSIHLESDEVHLQIEGDFSDLKNSLEFVGTRFEADLNFQSEFRQFLLREIGGLVGATMVKPLGQPAHYLPADRTGVMHAHKVVIASMVASAPFTGLGTNVSPPNLSGVLSDFLLGLMSMGNGSKGGKERHRRDLGVGIEQRMLRGTIQADQSDAGYPVFSYLPKGWEDKLPLMNSSSMVSELAPIILYLRHVVMPGEVLIIDEPESNLHPAMQVELVRQLAAIVNSGVRILLTTHSEWVLEALANLVLLSDLDIQKREGSLREEPALDKRDVGVWKFEKQDGHDGSYVKEIPLDADEGGFATGFDQTARLTYNQWAVIQDLLEK